MSLSNLNHKYSKNVPRYTSYPPLPYWKGAPSESEWMNHIGQEYQKEGVDLYIHIPYCQKLCYYCGCFKTVTKNQDLGHEYTQLIKKEWSIYQNKFPDIKIRSIHFGGGSPTFLRPIDLNELLESMAKNMSHDFLGSFEIDPRTVVDQHLKVLKAFNFDRLSLGIQDFDLDVQKTINREQSFAMVQLLVDKIRKLNFSSLNFDLIYGLPKQTLDSVTHTMEKVVDLSPDMLAIYHYAHLPERIPSQKLFKSQDLPSSDVKNAMYEFYQSMLKANGYFSIGMDHFGKETSYLYQAKLQHKLHRNFMGYTDSKTNVLIGLGISSISSTPSSYMQNTKEIKDYELHLNRAHLAIENGHILTNSDKEIDAVIKSLMCYGKLKKTEYAHIANEHISSLWSEAIHDQLVFEKNDAFDLTPTGMKNVRVLASFFDPYIKTPLEGISFSQN